MRAGDFRYKRLLSLEKQAEEEARGELAAAEKLRLEEAARLAQAREFLFGLKQAASSQDLSFAERGELSVLRQKAQRKHKEIEAQVAEAEAQVEARRNVVRRTQERRRSLASLEGKMWETLEKEEAARLQREIDGRSLFPFQQGRGFFSEHG